MATQAERRAATRAGILAAARHLFGAQGFATTTVDQIATAAGVAKGAVYHHFTTKEAVFEAVFEAVSESLAGTVAAAAAKAPDVLGAFTLGTRAYFEACAQEPLGRIILKDGPAVLGWAHWREIDLRHFGGTIPRVLKAAMKTGLMREQPVEPLARLLLGAVTEAAMACGGAADPALAGHEFAQALDTLVEGLRAR